MKFIIQFTTQELEMEDSLKQRIKFICEFCHVIPKIINGNIKKINKTNLSYIEPHRIIVNNTTFLAFNYSTDIYIENLNKKIKLSELEDYLKTTRIDISYMNIQQEILYQFKGVK